MTGFGRGERGAGALRYAVEIATVNRRNAEFVFNLPRELAACEPALRNLLAPAITRGRATLTASVTDRAAARPLLDRAVFRRLHGELSAMHRALRLPGAASFSDTARLYAACARADSAVPPPDPSPLLAAARAALAALQRMRAREGAHLAAELRRLLAAFAREVAAIRRLAPGVTRSHRRALRARLAAVAAGFAAGDARLAREVALLAERSDITEELSRLESHIAQFRAGLSGPGASGRPLDFLAQEMFRECNTIGSKANSAAVARRVVAAKTELERIREQVQNVE